MDLPVRRVYWNNTPVSMEYDVPCNGCRIIAASVAAIALVLR